MTPEVIQNTKILTPAELAKLTVKGWREPTYLSDDQELALEISHCALVYQLNETQAYLAGASRHEAIVLYEHGQLGLAQERLTSSYLIIWQHSPYSFDPGEVAKIEITLFGFQKKMSEIEIPKDNGVPDELFKVKSELAEGYALLYSKTLGRGIKGLGKEKEFYEIGESLASVCYRRCLAEAYHKHYLANVKVSSSRRFTDTSIDKAGSHWEMAREYLVGFYDKVKSTRALEVEEIATQSDSEKAQLKEVREEKERSIKLAGCLAACWRALDEKDMKLFIEFLANHCWWLYLLDANGAYSAATSYSEAISSYSSGDKTKAGDNLVRYYQTISSNSRLKLKFDIREVAQTELKLWEIENEGELAYGTTYLLATIFGIDFRNLHLAQQYFIEAINERRFIEHSALENLDDNERDAHWKNIELLLNAFYLELTWASHKQPQPISMQV